MQSFFLTHIFYELFEDDSHVEKQCWDKIAFLNQTHKLTDEGLSDLGNIKSNLTYFTLEYLILFKHKLQHNGSLNIRNGLFSWPIRASKIWPLINSPNSSYISHWPSQKVFLDHLKEQHPHTKTQIHTVKIHYLISCLLSHSF